MQKEENTKSNKNAIILWSIFVLFILGLMLIYAKDKDNNSNAITSQPNINSQSEAETNTNYYTTRAKEIIAGLIDDKGKYEVEINIVKASENHIKAEVFYNPGGGYVLAANKDGEWIKVLEGNGIPICGEISSYGFPADMVPSCLDEYREELIQNEWEEIKSAIANCNVKEVMQAHSLYVKADLKNGNKLEGFEPAIGDIILLAIEAQKKCGKILMATE